VRSTWRSRIMVVVWIVCVTALTPPTAWGDDLEFRPPPSPTDKSTAEVMRDLAIRLIPVYQEDDADRYLANVSALQMAARNYTAATASRKNLRERRRGSEAARPDGRAVIFDIYARARATEAERRVPFADSFARTYRDIVPRLSDLEAFAVSERFKISPTVYREALQRAFEQQRIRDSISPKEAVELIWAYLAFDAYRSVGPLVAGLDAEDDRRRYARQTDILVKTPAGASISVLVIRPTSAAKTAPALLEFSIDTSLNAARECAAHGYVGVVAYARGKLQSPQKIVPYQFDGEDARAVIEWTSRQSWSDGRVGMYGDGYSGFTAWSAAKMLPSALKAIATSAPSAPGINVPMAGGIYQNSAYRWSLYVTNTDAAQQESFYDDARWNALDQKWYRSGRPYRQLGQLNEKSNPIFIRWLNHPSYDRFWQVMIPYDKEFASIDIPVLTITGYYAGSQPGALYYFNEHLRHNREANHTLLIGPYDDAVAQRGPLAMLQGYQVDPAALIDVRELRYQWFDHVLKSGHKPALLKDRVNYQVMGSNEWRSAPTIDAMASSVVRFYLDPAGTQDAHRLSQRKGSRIKFVKQIVDLKDRGDAAWTEPTDFISKSLATRNSLMYVSDPLTKPFQFSGLLSGSLDFTVNKMDMDLNISVYELTPGGDYIHLFNPTYEFRASYAKDRVHRRLLQAGVRQQIAFRSERLTSRQFQKGSRLVMVLGLSKRPDREINYGTGNDVSEESVEDALAPFRIRWYADSYIEVPVRR
jgi:uncharacterized protein